MSTTIDSGAIFDLARKLAKEGAERQGEEFWSVRDVHINAARQQLMGESGGDIKKVITAPTAKDQELTRERLRAEWLHKYGLLGNTEDRDRLEFGTLSTSHGELVTSHDGRADILNIHGVDVKLGQIDVRLRDAIIASSAGFAMAQNQVEQAGQKAMLAAVVDSILHRHDDVGAQVRTAVQRQRFTAL